MKILHVTQGYWPAIGGTEWLIQRISEQLYQDYGDEITVFTTNCYNGEAFWNPSLPRMPLGEETINGVHIRRFPVRSRISKSLRNIQRIAHYLEFPGNDLLRTWFQGPIIIGLKQEIARFSADVVAASSFPLLHMYKTLQGGKQSGKPVVLHGGLHPQDEWGFNRPMIFRAIQQANHYISNTTYEAEYLRQFNIPREKITVIGTGVDPEPFANLDGHRAKHQIGLDEHMPVVGFIGQIGGHKGVDTIMRAIPTVWESMPNTQFLIAGARTQFIPQLENFYNSLNFDKQKLVKIIYNFKIEDKPTLFAAVDVFAYPSGYESFGIAFLEAWASRKPVISCWRGAIPSVVSAGKDGLLVDFQNEEMLAAAMLTLLQNPEYATRLGESGYRKMQQNYTWKEITRRFREVYLSVCS